MVQDYVEHLYLPPPSAAAARCAAVMLKSRRVEESKSRRVEELRVKS